MESIRKCGSVSGPPVLISCVLSPYVRCLGFCMILHLEGLSLQKRQQHTIAILGGFSIASVGIGCLLGVNSPFYRIHWHS